MQRKSHKKYILLAVVSNGFSNGLLFSVAEVVVCL
jgi:hypothetical protein